MLVDLRQREAVMAVTYDASNPMLMRLRQQIQTVQSQLASMKDTTTRMSLNQSPIASWVDQEIITSRAELAPLTDQKLHDKEQLEKIDDELRHIEQADIKIRVLDSRIGDQNENLKTMRQLYSKVRSEDEMDLAKVTSVVQTADSMALDRPVAPNKLFFAVGGILAGLISACGVMVFVTITNRTFLSDESLERYLGLPVLGSMPLQAHERRRLV
jgi:capsular polysaccharide biosynthesis protein